MSPNLSEQITATPAPPAPVQQKPDSGLPGATTPAPRKLSSTSPRRLFWGLVGLAVALNGLIVYLGYLLIFDKKTINPPPDRKIAVPFADKKAILDKWRVMPTQEDGRVKPFGTVAIEVVRSITGREKFEGKDPVAVVLSWMMLYEPEPTTRKIDYDRIEARSKDPRDPRPWTGLFAMVANEVANRPDTNKIDSISRKVGCNWDAHPFILCDYQELRQRIYREHLGEGKELTEEQKHGKYIEPDALRHSNVLRDLIKSAEAKRAEDEKAKLSMLESKAQEVYGRLRLYERTRSLGEFAVAALDGNHKEWFRLDHLRYFFVSPPEDEGGKKIGGEYVWKRRLADMRVQHDRAYRGKPEQPYPGEGIHKIVATFAAAQKAYRAKDENAFTAASEHFISTVDAVSRELTSYPTTDTIDLELTFNRVVPFQKAWIYGLLASVLLGVSVLITPRWLYPGRAFYFAGLAGYLASLGYAVFGFYCRVRISGRPPVSDMYESIIFVAFMTAFFGLVFEMIYRRGLIALAGALVSTLGFVLADQLPLVFSPSIKPLNAVLRSNYWLIVHVMTIVASYAAFALAWGLGNINLALITAVPERKDLIKTLSFYSYKAIQVGVILLFLGTMLGGWWAAESWGRFWGWDPKEVWALIAFLCYVIPLHARYVGWVKDFGLAACSVICFASVVMAWYGVNFILGAGLHSYGFGSGNNRWVYFACLANISLVVHAGIRYLSRYPQVAAR